VIILFLCHTVTGKRVLQRICRKCAEEIILSKPLWSWYLYDKLMDYSLYAPLDTQRIQYVRVLMLQHLRSLDPSWIIARIPFLSRNRMSLFFRTLGSLARNRLHWIIV
jgi:hypothetical protein